MNVNWKFLKNPWAVIGGIFSLVILFGLILFSVQVVRYVGQIRSGAPNPFEAKTAEKKAQLIFRQPALKDDVRAQVEMEGGNPMLGNPEATIRLVEFLDYECPFCKRSAPDVRAFLARHS
ncbi:MAG: thioredoxin domain-containing protein, partial [bacterium]|nr:thioredoxin domain-containing protein [bacterium]